MKTKSNVLSVLCRASFAKYFAFLYFSVELTESEALEFARTTSPTPNSPYEVLQDLADFIIVLRIRKLAPSGLNIGGE